MWYRLSYNPRALVMLAILVGVSLLNPLWQALDHQRYQLSHEAGKLVGPANQHLAEKISLNTSERKFEFNANGKTTQPEGDDPAAVAAQLAHKQQTGGAGEENESLYALDLPIDPTEGATFYDINTQTSFSMTPQFAKGEARSENGQIIYPVLDGGQAVYTAKANGVKEDIILETPRGDELSFAYQLELPETLEAKIIKETGELGIYSADPVLFGDISFGSEADEEKVQNARLTAPKDHLTFVLPAPVILQRDHAPHEATAEFTLEDNLLTVSARGLQQLNYPISVDPSVIVTSTSDFLQGNNEGNITFDTDSISRSRMKSGETEPWTAGSNLTTTRAFTSAVTYNGHIYTGGGFSNTWGGLATVEYAPINTDGTLGAWQTTTAFPSGRWYHSMATYNGYLYSIGGAVGGSASTEVIFAQINPDGSVGSWQSTTSLPGGRNNFAADTYDGKVYVFGGNNGTTDINTVQYAHFQGDGTLSSWQDTTSLTATRQYTTAAIYNGYAYIMGGLTGGSQLGQVEYARINDDGSLGSWSATTAYAPTRYGARAAAVDGYIYLIGGIMDSDYYNTVQYAPIHADGSLGVWRDTNTTVTARAHGGIATHQGRVYLIGGTSGGDGTDITNTTEFTALRPAGYTTSYTEANPFATTRTMPAVVAHNGYIYISGGLANDGLSTVTSTVQYAPLNADGTVGTWQAGTALPVSRYAHGMVAYNDHMYLLGGITSGGITNVVHFASINTNGSLGTWTAAANNFTNARGMHGSAVYNGNLYIAGGTPNGTTYLDDVQYAPIQANGNVGSWSATTAMPDARAEFGFVQNGDILYRLGGRNATTVTSAVYYASINADGTVGTWMATNAFPAPALMTMGATAANGHLYMAGGRLGSGVAQSNAFYARILADGGLEPWQATTSLPGARFGNQLASSNGYLYSLGGHNNTNAFNTIYFAFTGNGGNGYSGTWAGTTSLITARSLHGAVAHHGRVYAFGGINAASSPINTVEYATIQQDGSLSNWTATTSLPAPRAYFGSVVSSGHIYVIGGYSSVSPITPTNTVYYAPINTDGTIGTWETGPTFTTARGAVAAATYQTFGNNYIYLTGGYNGTNTRYNDVQFAHIDPDTGALSGWSSTTSFTRARAAHDAVAYGARLYIFGGQEHSTLTILNDVQHAPINTDGTIGNWERTTSFNTPRFGIRVFAHNGYMYITGGNNNSVAFARTEYAAINSNGRLGTWQTSPATFTTARNNHAIAHERGKLYVIGGNNTAGGRLGDTQYAGLSMQQQSGLYSRLIDFGRPVRLLSMNHSTVPYARTNMLYATAGEDGVFSERQPTTTFTGPADGVRYVQIYATLNDSLRGEFGVDVRTALTDITFDYRPTYLPEERLRHGKFFYDGEMFQMDTE